MILSSSVFPVIFGSKEVNTDIHAYEEEKSYFRGVQEFRIKTEFTDKSIATQFCSGSLSSRFLSRN